MRPIKITLSEGDILLTVGTFSDSKIVNEINVLKDGKEAIDSYANCYITKPVDASDCMDVVIKIKNFGSVLLPCLENNNENS